MSLRLLWLCADFPWPLTSGNSVSVFYRIRELVKRGYQVQLFSTATNIVPDESVHALRQYCEDVRVYRTTQAELGMNLIRHPFMPFRTMRRYSAALLRDMASAALSGHYDVLIVEHSNMAIYCPPIPLRRVKTVLVLHSLVHKSFWREARYYPRKWSFKRYVSYVEAVKTRWFERGLFERRLFDDYWFHSEDDIDDVVTQYPTLRSQARFLPIPVERSPCIGNSAMLDGIKREDRVILITGSMDNPSNEDAARWFAEKIFPIIRESVPEAKFCIVGKSSKEKLSDLVSDSVVVVGEVPSLDPYLYRCDVCVVPQRGGGGVRTKFVDGLSAKKIVIATPVGVEAIKDIQAGVHYLLARDEREFAKLTIQVIRYPSQYEAVAKKGYDVFQNIFSADAVGKWMERHLLNLTNS